MGNLLCSRSKNDTTLVSVSPSSPRSPRFKRASQLSTTQNGASPDADSLLKLSLDAFCRTLHLQDPHALRNLHIPPDVAQHVVDRLIETTKLDDVSVRFLKGQTLFQLDLNSYPEPIQLEWVRCLISESLEILDLSWTQVNKYWLFY